MDDLEAVTATMNGNPEAFSVLVERYTPILFRLVDKMSGPDDPVEEKEEAVQEIFLKAYRSLHTFDTRYRFYTWIYSIGINHLRSRRRKKRSSRLFGLLPYDDGIQKQGTDSPPRYEMADLYQRFPGSV